MGLENLFQGLQMFQQGLKEYSTSRAIGQATDAVNQLNQSELTDQQKRVAHMQLANQLALHLGQLGAPVSQIQSATGAIKPETPKSLDEMMLQGMLEGKPELVKQAQEMQTMINEPKIKAEREKMKLQHSYDIAKVDRAGMWDVQKAQLSAAGKVKTPVVPKTQWIGEPIEFSESERTEMRNTVATTESMIKTIGEIDKIISEYGTESMPGKVKARLQALNGSLNSQTRIAEGLGVLNKADVDFIDSVKGDPTAFFSIGGNYRAQFDAWKENMLVRAEDKLASRNLRLDHNIIRAGGAAYKDILMKRAQQAVLSGGGNSSSQEEQQLRQQLNIPAGTVLMRGKDKQTGQEGIYIYDPKTKRNLGPWSGGN